MIINGYLLKVLKGRRLKAAGLFLQRTVGKQMIRRLTTDPKSLEVFCRA